MSEVRNAGKTHRAKAKYIDPFQQYQLVEIRDCQSSISGWEALVMFQELRAGHIIDLLTKDGANSIGIED